MFWWEKIKVNIIPVFLNVGDPQLAASDWIMQRCKQLTSEQRDAFIKIRLNSIEKYFRHTNLLDPVILESLSDLEKLKDKLNYDVDLILPVWVGGARWAIISTRLGDLGKPILMVGFPHYDNPTLAEVAGLKAQGKEVYYAVNVLDPKLNDTLKIMRTKKQLRASKIIAFPAGSRGSQEVHPGTIGYDPRVIKSKLGIMTEYWQEWRLIDETKKILDSEAEAVANSWLGQATEIREIFTKGEVQMKYLAPAAKIYLALKNIVRDFDATAFTGCLSYRWVVDDIKTTPCIVYVHLKDEGIPCGCENDVTATICKMMLMYLSKKPADMGNFFIPTPETDDDREISQTLDMPHVKAYVPPIDPPGENTIILTHCVTPLKMDGLDKASNVYSICGTFCTDDWQTPVTYTPLKEGQKVTLPRLGPLADKMLITEGTIVKSCINPVEGVRNATYIELQYDALDYYHKIAEVGHHPVFVYGEYAKELTDLCEDLNIEVI